MVRSTIDNREARRVRSCKLQLSVGVISAADPTRMLTHQALAERGKFELPVPIGEQSDGSIGLSFATSRRTATLSPCSTFLCALGLPGATGANCPFIGSLLRHQARCRSSRTRGMSPPTPSRLDGAVIIYRAKSRAGARSARAADSWAELRRNFSEHAMLAH